MPRAASGPRRSTSWSPHWAASSGAEAAAEGPMAVLEKVWQGIEQSLLMAYEVWWALVIGFAISGIVQAWVPRARIESALSGEGFAPIAKATGLGAASSSC